MKKVIGFFSLLTFLIVFLTGCNIGQPNKTAGPGSVLGLDQTSGSSQKVVTFGVVGKGLEPENALTKGEAKLMAERAAVADGYRQMVEKLRGVYVDAFMKAGYGTVNQDVIITKTQSWLRGVEILEIREAQYGISEAHMQLSVYFAKKDMVWWPSGLGPKLRPPQDQLITPNNLSNSSNTGK